jgi:hypothetical protein
VAVADSAHERHRNAIRSRTELRQSTDAVIKTFSEAVRSSDSPQK